jgi:hypothetical protein
VADGFAADGFQRGDATESGDKSFNMPLQLRPRKSLPEHKRISIKRTNRPPSASKPGMDENEPAAIRDEVLVGTLALVDIGVPSHEVPSTPSWSSDDPRRRPTTPSVRSRPGLLTR